MDEADYWIRLEFRVGREFAGMPERRLRYFWCDGFYPAEYRLSESRPHITGRSWICEGSEQVEWKFSLLLPRSYRSREEIDWATLLPPDEMTQWLTMDEDQRVIEIEPSVAVPDQSECCTEDDGLICGKSFRLPIS